MKSVSIKLINNIIFKNPYRGAVEDNNMINDMTPVSQTPVKMSLPFYDPVPRGWAY